ncbi:MAG TPA: sigma-70 family RNA polymerase sigma factor [Chitinophagaceae bacterium]|nr:sigma-70 family RNA polymerase sigma factor [Chitinophagaceae bacterium]
MSSDHIDNVWNSFRNGNWISYGQLYDDHYRALNNYGYKFTKDVSLIEDAIHDLFVKLWTNRSTLGDTPPSVRNYLYKALRNILFRKIKAQSRFSSLESDDYDYTFEVSCDNLLIEDEEEKLLRNTIKDILEKLPARQKEIVYLRFYEGLSYEEVAEVMAIDIHSVYKLWYKAMDGLKDSMHYLISWYICAVLIET